MASTTSFNPAMFIYLNPQLSVVDGVINVDQAVDYYNTFGDQGGTLFTSMAAIPQRFDEYVYLTDYRSNVDISSLNQIIKAALSNQGLTNKEIEDNGRYVTTIFKDAMLSNVNIFKFNNLATNNRVYISPSNLNVGDQIKIVKNNLNTYYAVVDEILDNETFRVRNDLYDFQDFTGQYIVHGIKLYDPYRLATINYLKYLQATASPPSTDLYYDDTNFNPDLYRLLYADARHLDDAGAYSDFVNRKDSSEIRIGRTKDIQTVAVNYPNTFQNIEVLTSLHLNYNETNGFFQWDDVIMRYVTTDSNRPSSEIPPGSEGLITERAIKWYVEEPYLTTAVFNNVIINSNLLLYGSNNFAQNITLSNVTVEGATMQVETDADFVNNVGVMGALMGPRIGIGPYVMPIDENTLRLNQDHLTVKKLEVGVSNLTESDIVVKVHGLVEAQNINPTSDLRLKNNIVKINYKGLEHFTELLDRVDLYNYNWKHKHTTKGMGFIAQEIETAFPDAVSTIPMYEVPIGSHIKWDGDIFIDNATYSRWVSTDNTELNCKECEGLVVDGVYLWKHLGDWIVCDTTSNILLRYHSNSYTRNELFISKGVYKNIKIIDYQYLTCVLFGIVKDLKAKCIHPPES